MLTLPTNRLEQLIDVGVHEKGAVVLTFEFPGRHSQVVEVAMLFEHSHPVRDSYFPIKELPVSPEPTVEAQATPVERTHSLMAARPHTDRACNNGLVTHSAQA